MWICVLGATSEGASMGQALGLLADVWRSKRLYAVYNWAKQLPNRANLPIPYRHRDLTIVLADVCLFAKC